MSAQFENKLIDAVLWGSLAAVLIFFYIPIFTLIAFSFQQGRFLTLPFEGLSLRWYGELFRNANALTALWNSTLIAAVTMLIATAIGTMAAIVAVRYRFRGRESFRLLAGVPLAFPQLLLGIVLLLWFSVLGRVFDFSTGVTTAIISGWMVGNQLRRRYPAQPRRAS